MDLELYSRFHSQTLKCNAINNNLPRVIQYCAFIDI